MSKNALDGSDASLEGVIEFGEGGLAHTGTVRSACFDEKRNVIVSQGEDMIVKWVVFIYITESFSFELVSLLTCILI